MRLQRSGRFVQFVHVLSRRSVLAVLAAVFCAGAFLAAARADRVRLRDGTVLEGTVIQQEYGYWVKTADGQSHRVMEADVDKVERATAQPPAPPAAPQRPAGAARTGTAPPASRAPAAAGTPVTAIPAPPPPPGTATGRRGPATAPAAPSFVLTARKADAVESPLAAVVLWQQFIDVKPPPKPAELDAARKELAKWQARAADGAEKINDRWVGGEELHALIEKTTALYEESAQMLEHDQTLGALKKLQEAAELYPNDFRVNFSLGYIALVEHNAEKALPWFERALKQRPDSPEALTDYGVIQIAQERYEEGITSIYKALQVRDDKQIVLDLVTAIAMSPPAFHTLDSVQEAAGAARLVGEKYQIHGPDNKLTVIGLLPESKQARGHDKPGGAKPHGGGERQPELWSGTGFLVSDDGLILTNRHVAANAKSLMILLPNAAPPAAAAKDAAKGAAKDAAKGAAKDKEEGAQVTATVVAIDDEQDLALIRVSTDGKKLPFLRFSPTDAPGDGAECTVIGYPLLTRLGMAVKITRGIVSSSGAFHTHVEDGRRAVADVMVDAKVNPGNSGGPMLDKHGNVMAIISMKTISTQGEDTFGLGISAGQIRKFLTKNKIRLIAGDASGEPLSTEDIATLAKPATVCILAVGR